MLHASCEYEEALLAISVYIDLNQALPMSPRLPKQATIHRLNWSTSRVVDFDDANVIRGPHRAVGSSPRSVESLRLRTHIWSMLGEIHLDPSPQPAKNG